MLQTNAQLQAARTERVALAHVAGFVAAAEPAQALLGGAVSKGIRHYASGRLLLKSIVADGARRS